MQKNAYHYLFQEDTLFRVVEPEPLVVPPAPQPVSAPVRSVAEVLQPEQPATSVPVPIQTTPVAPEPAPVVPIQVTPDPPAPTAPQLNHKILILVDEELNPSEQILLENILKAVHLNLDGVDLLNLAGSGIVDFKAVLENKTIHHFISFGVPFPTVHLDIHLDRYHPVRFFGITFLLSDPLSALEADQMLKRQLWAVLKKTFLNS